MSQAIYDVIVIGEGVSGLTAAGALAAEGLKVATMEAQLFGGLIINVNELEPAPPGKPASGAEFAAEMMQANGEAGVESLQEEVTGVRDDGGLKQVITASGTHGARRIIIASGGRLKRLGVPGEAQFEGRGVSQCADCDGPMYQDETAVVIGGGDSALQEALVLTNYCRRVILVHRGAEFRGAAHFAQQVTSNDKISVIWNATVEAILGTKTVEKARVRHRDGRVEELACAGVFAYIGLAPNTEFLPTEIGCDSAGYVKTNENLQTTLSGIWAIGAVRSGFGGTLTHAETDARQAADALRAGLT